MALIFLLAYGTANTLLANIAPDTGTIVKKQSVSAGVNYGTDISFFGRTSQYRYPFLSGDVIYNSKPGLFVYGSLWKVLASVPTIDEFDLGAGYHYRFSKAFRGDISYTRFFINDKSQIIKSSASNDINFKNSYDWKYVKTSATLDYLFGKSSDFFVTISNSKYFESNWSVFDDKDYLTFEPAFTMIFGTQNFVQDFSQNHDFFNNPPGHGPGMHYDPYPPPDVASKNSQFNLLNYSFKLPIAYNRPHYTLEAAYKYAIPVNVQGALINNHESFFNLTFYYVFY
ncbi:hypothetical protein ACFGVR_13275 [Mucilaginibacter sp. AW1-3]